MLLTWLPSYLQTAKGLCVMNAGMLTAVPFGAATVVAVAAGHASATGCCRAMQCMPAGGGRCWR